MYAVEADSLTKTFGRITAVDKVSFKVKEGETFGLLGPNGAGKTTMVRVLNCIIKSTGGQARVNGYDIDSRDMDVKRTTGFLAESPGLYDKLSAYEFLEFMGALYDVPPNILPRRIEELLELFGLSERRDSLLEGFSRGMKQKMMIAAALVHDPPTLFLDEPTSTLDPRAAAMVKDLIKGLARRADKTVVICSHILPIVEELCDRIGIIYNGRLVAVGTVGHIRKKAGKRTLEEAFIALTGGVEKKELLSWRGQKA